MKPQQPTDHDTPAATPEGPRRGAAADAARQGWGRGADSALQHMKQLERAKAQELPRRKRRPDNA